MNSKEGLTMMRVAGALGFWAFLAVAGCKGNINNGSLPLTTTDRVSVSTAGGELNGGSSDLSISEDGNRIVFTTAATNVIPGGTSGFPNVYVHDVAAGTTELVSVDPTGLVEGNAASDGGRISADGRYVAFHSAATNLVAADVNAAGAIYRRDLNLKTTVRVTVANGGGDTAAGCTVPEISQDGQFIAFQCALNSVGPGTAAAVAQIHRRDMNQAVNTGTWMIRVSAEFGGGITVVPCLNQSISGDGHLIAFQTADSSMLAVAEGSLDQDVFLWTEGVVVGTGITTRLSNAFGGGEATGQSTSPAISLDGLWVVFQSTASNIVAPGEDTNGLTDVFRVSTAGGNAERVSLSSTDQQPQGAGTGAFEPSISRDGRFVAFSTDVPTLFGGDINAAQDVVIRDVAAHVTFPASVQTYGGHTEFGSFSGGGRIAGNGKFVAFFSTSAILSANDNNGIADAFRRGPF